MARKPLERVVEALARLERVVAHVTVLLPVPQLLDALLGEGHDEHVDGNAGDGVGFGLGGQVVALHGLFLGLAFVWGEFRGVREGLCSYDS